MNCPKYSQALDTLCVIVSNILIFDADSLSPLINLPKLDAASNNADPNSPILSPIDGSPLNTETIPSFTNITPSSKPLNTAPIFPAV